MSELGKGTFSLTATAPASEEISISTLELLPKSHITTPPATIEISNGPWPEMGIMFGTGRHVKINKAQQKMAP